MKNYYLLPAFILLAFKAFSVNYYVKRTGNNSNDGLTYATAFKTIQQGLNEAGAGDSILVDGGLYKERLQWMHSGAAGQFVTLTNYNGSAVHVEGGGAQSDHRLLQIIDKNFVRVTNIEFRNHYMTDATGVYISGAGRQIQILNCFIYNIGWDVDPGVVPFSNLHNAHAIHILGNSTDSLRNILISGNHILNCVTGFSEALTVSGNVSNFTIQNNFIHDITNIGIDCAGHYQNSLPTALDQARNGVVKNNRVFNCVFPGDTICSGIYVDGGKNIVVERNRCYSNDVGISVGCENPEKSASNITVRNNQVYNNNEVGMFIGAGDSGGTITDCQINNNTFYKNYTIGGYGAELSLQNGDHTSLLQNIFYPSNVSIAAIGMFGDFLTTNMELDYNLYWRSNGNLADLFSPGVAEDMHAVYGNPKFINTNSLITPNLHLRTGSAAINVGDPAFLAASGEADYDNQSRVQQGRVDIGMDETALSQFSETGAVLQLQAASFAPDHLQNMDENILIYPVPTGNEIHIQYAHHCNGDVVYTLSDSFGRQQFQVKKPSQVLELLDVSRLAPGIYFLKIEMDGEAIMKHFVKN